MVCLMTVHLHCKEVTILNDYRHITTLNWNHIAHNRRKHIGLPAARGPMWRSMFLCVYVVQISSRLLHPNSQSILLK